MKATSWEVLKMLAEKKLLGVEELEAQTALELPDREMLALVNVIVAGNNVAVPIGIAANVCGVNAAVLAQDFAQDGSAECRAQNDFEIGQGALARFGVVQ